MTPARPEYPSAELMNKTINDVYFGDARRPGLTTRTETLEERADGSDRAQGTTDKKFNAILVLLITLLGGVVTELIKGR